MTQEQIKTSADYCLEAIRVATEELEKIRKQCNHPNTFEGNWSYRIGVIMPAYICEDCKALVKYKE